MNNYVYNLSESEFSKEIELAKGSRKRSLLGQRSFEKLLIEVEYKIGLYYQYINGGTKVSIICSEGHSIDMTPSDFKSGCRCRVCAGVCPEASKNKLLELAIKDGYLVIGCYVKNNQKVEMLCPNNHTINITPSDFKSNKRCAKCSGVCAEQAMEDFFSLAKKKGFKVVGRYINSSTKIEVSCPNSHKIKIVPSQFKAGHGCVKCVGQCPDESKRELYLFAEKVKYTVKGEYIKNSLKLDFVCDQHHDFSMTPHNFKSGHRCPKCMEKCPEQAKTRFLELVLNDKYIFSGPFTDNETKVNLICPEGHVWFVTPKDYKAGYRCSSCADSGYSPTLSGVLYFTFLENERQKLIKIGITNKSAAHRMTSHGCHSEFNHSLICEFKWADGLVAQKIEGLIKAKFIGRQSDHKFDGYTETFKVTDLIPALSIVKSEVPDISMDVESIIENLPSIISSFTII